MCVETRWMLVHLPLVFQMESRKIMSTKIPSEVEADETAQQCAQWEQFSFDVEAPGMVDVTNESNENPADHQYVVSIDDVTEKLMACTCPHHVHRNAFEPAFGD